MSASGETLTRAYELIEADRLDEAQSILKPLLETDKNNPDVWWLYAHSVADEDTARFALNNVLRLDHAYPGAVDLMKQINERSGDGDFFTDEITGDPSFLPAIPSTLPGLSAAGSSDSFDPDFDDDFDIDDDLGVGKEARAGRRPTGRRNLVLGAALIGIVIIAAVAVFILTRPRSAGTPAATATPNIASVPTSGGATLVPENIDTQPTEPPFQSQSASPAASLNAQAMDGLQAALGEFTLSESDPIAVRDTTLGSTLMVSICATPGTEARSVLNDAMTMVALQTGIYEGMAEAIGIEIIDCDTGSPILLIGVPTTVAVEFASGNLTERDFQGSWRPAG